MNFNEFKKVVRQGDAEVHILCNQGSLYLIQIINEGVRSLLTQNRSTRPQVFRGLSECYGRLISAGLHCAFVDQACAHDEMISRQGYGASRVDQRLVRF
ncbi:conserved hypothetical protein [Oleispira antarctica RB-8]|uniref:Uncharacterized protein n=1 Tax=Oleispira antarctica RB-8 TaxID=698738 RepID=R4YSN2_OLEAN|nr:conserved hypothetical protein [Oleispira antarctica RB-8]